MSIYRETQALIRKRRQLQQDIKTNHPWMKKVYQQELDVVEEQLKRKNVFADSLDEMLKPKQNRYQDLNINHLI